MFDEYLLDADWSLNTGNWLWLSTSAFFHQFFRVYSPITFAQKTDKTGEYIRRYLPVLKQMPAEYIYEPWNAPLAVQKRAGCIVGVDYPGRICEFAEAKQRSMNGLKIAYEVRRSGVVYSRQQLAELATENIKLWCKKGNQHADSTSASIATATAAKRKTESTASDSAAPKKVQRSIADFVKKNKKAD